jgi:general secretion pathway protein C
MMISINAQSLSKNPVMLLSALLFASAVALLLISIILLLAALFYSPTPSLFNPEQKSFAGQVNIEDIGSRNFFGIPAAEPSIEEVTLPETELALILRGAFAQTDQEGAGAIIENQDTRIANHFIVGEPVTEDSTLKAVYKDRVVLTRNGRLETLYFPDLADSSGIGQVKNRNTTASGGAGNISNDEARKRRDAIRERIKQLRNR